MIRSEDMSIAEWAEAISRVELTDIQKELLEKCYAKLKRDRKEKQRMHVLNGDFEPDDLRKLADALEATDIRPGLSCFQFITTDETFRTLLNELDKCYGYKMTSHTVNALTSCKDCHAYSYCGNKKEEN